MVDLGSGSLGPLQRYAAVNQIDAVALSHLHADHFIESLAEAQGTFPGPVTLAAPGQVIDLASAG